MNFVKASLKYKQVTFSVLLIVFIFGVNSLLNMPRREDPFVTIPGGLIVAYYPGATASEVEDQVTRKLEEYLFQYAEVRKDKTFSVSSDGMVVVHIWLQDNVTKPDIFWSKLRHQLLLGKAIDLPQGVRGPVVNSDFGDTESLIIGMESDAASYSEMSDYMTRLEERVRIIPEVSKIKRIGEQKEQVTISFNSFKIAQYDLNLAQIVKVLQSQNTISPTGQIKEENLSTPLYTGGVYRNIEDLSSQIVGVSKTGAVIHLGDIASLKREYSEPTEKISVNGHKAILLTIQMYEGKNIVKSGRKADKIAADFAAKLPSAISLTTIANQPQVVDKNISHFLFEFLIAIGAVILVIVLLLPLRIAAVAATAIPMTISITFAMMHVLGIELQQVSLATLIVVLGMVVDDAVVIADNYVELLDRGNDRWTAAWRSATDLVVPVLTATITIIGAFLPLVILTGAIGEFIRALPLTVAIALSSSFLVAMFLTPLLCYILIRRGLMSSENMEKKHFFLDLMQATYNKSIEWCLKRPAFTIISGLLTIILAAILFKTTVRQKFFPEAERDQFSVELWMPTGTKLEKTEKAILRIESLLKNDRRVKSYATFVGRSAPRFYYNYSPEVPVSNYAQILINTSDKKATESLYGELKSSVGGIVPEGRPHVRLMQQGQPLTSPVEIRIAGDDINKLKELGDQVSSILRNIPGTDMIRNDFREDYYGLRLQPKPGASRLGFTTTSISQMVYTSFCGYPVTTMYEGDKQVNIVLKLDGKYIKIADDLQNLYLQSPVTGASVPLREIADLVPQWNTGAIMHRTGIRTLTVMSEVKDGRLPSEILKKARPKLDGIKLTDGYSIYFGGEQANKSETYGYMAIALVISLIIIFMVLIFQFRNIKEVGLVMLTIPLSLFGAIFGLIITGNEFGFTAFTGLISLSGIVVRNAIILIDHTNELMEKGLDIPTAAYEAGKRRLRPIFLTAMAAAIGVVPMILSGSPLWSPLASVIAFGVMWSMLISTLVIPVMYIATMKPGDKKYYSETVKTEASAN
jgi:multidrug efflux pump subunit AcrB